MCLNKFTWFNITVKLEPLSLAGSGSIFFYLFQGAISVEMLVVRYSPQKKVINLQQQLQSSCYFKDIYFKLLTKGKHLDLEILYPDFRKKSIKIIHFLSLLITILVPIRGLLKSDTKKFAYIPIPIHIYICKVFKQL